MTRKTKNKPITSDDLLLKNAPWTPGPWGIGPKPLGHCRIFAPSETHAIARTYGPNLNNIGVCQLTGPRNFADAALISLAPAMGEVIGWLWMEQEALNARKPEEARTDHDYARKLAVRIHAQLLDLLKADEGRKT